MPSEYRVWWDFIRSGNNQHEVYSNWFSQHKNQLPSSITSMVSIGAGCGDLDTEVIQRSLTGLESYIGVEPDPDNRETLRVNMATECPEVKLQVVSEPVGVWQGPSEPVDLILAVQVFYYFSDPVAALQQLYSWLRPGGVLIIGHSDSDSMYAGIAKEAGLGGDYWVSSLREDLKRAGYNHFKEYKMACTVDHGSTFNEEMVKRYFKLNILKGKDDHEDNLQKCVDIFRTRFENRDQYQTYHNGIILLEKRP